MIQVFKDRVEAPNPLLSYKSDLNHWSLAFGLLLSTEKIAEKILHDAAKLLLFWVEVAMCVCVGVLFVYFNRFDVAVINTLRTSGMMTQAVLAGLL